MAPHQKSVRRRGAELLLIDESGLLMAPLLRRTWAPRGCRPELLQRGRHREKVSVASALWLSPRRRRPRLSFRTLVDGYFDSAATAEFLRSLLGESRRPLVVLWDGGTMHKGEPIRALLRDAGRRLRLERLPPYAPMLNPVEPLWSWLKYSRLCNFAPRDARHLNEVVAAELNALSGDHNRLASFCQASELSDAMTLLL